MGFPDSIDRKFSAQIDVQTQSISRLDQKSCVRLWNIRELAALQSHFVCNRIVLKSFLSGWKLNQNENQMMFQNIMADDA